MLVRYMPREAAVWCHIDSHSAVCAEREHPALQDPAKRTPPIPTARVIPPMRRVEALQLCRSKALLPSEALVDATMQVHHDGKC